MLQTNYTDSARFARKIRRSDLEHHWLAVRTRHLILLLPLHLLLWLPAFEPRNKMKKTETPETRETNETLKRHEAGEIQPS
jgi:hypothetical protein